MDLFVVNIARISSHLSFWVSDVVSCYCGSQTFAILHIYKGLTKMSALWNQNLAYDKYCSSYVSYK
jgi:hypothetical protein